jgi:hypothetical protein
MAGVLKSFLTLIFLEVIIIDSIGVPEPENTKCPSDECEYSVQRYFPLVNESKLTWKCSICGRIIEP